MIKSLSTLLLVTFSVLAVQAQNIELGLLASPLKKDDVKLSLIYRNQIGESQWAIRSYANFEMSKDKLIRADSITMNRGRFEYQLAAGVQRSFRITSNRKLSAYWGTDFYWNSMFLKTDQNSYYGYHYNFGVFPLLGLNVKLSSKINTFIEMRSDLNINLQSYTADLDNYDRKYHFNTLDHFALGITYTLRKSGSR